MTARGYALFDTAVGRCGIAWGERGVVGVQLPESSAAATRARVRKRFGDARESPLPKPLKSAVADIVALLRGEKRDLSKIDLDMDGVPEFHRRVYVAARGIPPGSTVTYGEIAKRLGEPGAARAVGQALGRNPFAIVVPCHRVLAAGGKSGGFSAKGGVGTKLRMLAIEGARVSEPSPPLGLFEADTGYSFDPRVALAHVRASDPRLATLIDTAGPFALELKSTSSVFVALAEAIVYQQLSVKAAGTIFARVCALFPRGRGGPRPEHVLRATDASLRGAGLSNAKMLALQDLARRTLSGELPRLAALRKMDDDAIVESLSAVRGVGRWTAEMFLIFRLGRPDVLPVDDYGIRKGFAIALGKRALPTPKDVLKYGERWRPYRTLASWALEQDPG
jgi:O-6-methylguanine DNA methyltransferase